MLARQHSFVVEEEHGFPKLPRPEGVKGQGFFVYCLSRRSNEKKIPMKNNKRLKMKIEVEAVSVVSPGITDKLENARRIIPWYRRFPIKIIADAIIREGPKYGFFFMAKTYSSP